VSQNAFVLRSAASLDLKSIASQLEERSAGKAIQFFSAVRSTVELLTEMPFMGAPADMGEERLHSMRYVRVDGFKIYLIFYRPLASKDGIVVHRILHQSRQVEPLLLESLDDDD